MKVKTAKRVMAGFLCMIMIAGTLLGCSKSGSEKENKPNDEKKATTDTDGSKIPEEKEKAAKIVHFYNFDWADDNFQNTDIGVELQKRTNTELTLMKSPTSDNTKLNVMLTSGQLPDIITLDRNDPMVSKLIESGQVYALSDLIDEYAPQMRETSEKEYYEYYNWTDGKQYYFPNFLITDWDIQQPNCDPVAKSFNAFRSDVYEAIGSPQIKTADQLFDALMAAKEKYPNLTPWYFGPFNQNNTFFKASEFNGNMFPATQFGVKLYEVQDGNVVSGVRTEKFQNFIKFMNKCYTNDLLAAESFADTSDISVAKLAEGKFAMVTGDQNTLPEGVKIQDSAKASWTPMPYLEGAEYFKDGAGWTATFITKNCKDLEGVMRYVSYCASEEGRLLISTGIEGVHWQYEEIDGKKVPRFLPEWDELRLSNWSEFTKKGGFTNNFAFEDNYIHNVAYTKFTSEKSDYYKKLDEYYKPFIKADIAIGLINPSGTSEEGTIQSKISELSISYYPKMVMAKNETKAMEIYHDFIEKLDEFGLKKLENIWAANLATAGK